MKRMICGALLLAMATSFSAYAAKMVCERCVILSNGDITCYNCRIE